MSQKQFSESELTQQIIDQINFECDEIEEKVIQWRRIIHENPELGNREFKTSKLVSEHLQRLGMKVTYNVAHTGVVGLLQGSQNEPVVALRADMDALPIKEALDLPFSSQVTAIYNGREVPVMHACGHDAHTAILMGVAEVLSKISDKIPGSIKFIFQPSEDSRPDGEDGGAKLMIDQGVLSNPPVDAIFGLHVVPLPVGCIGIRSGGLMAGVDNFWITVRGRATHGGLPWTGIDPIPITAQIVIGLQTIVSRQLDITHSPAVVTIGRIHGGEQPNMVTNEVEITGTIRTYDPNTNQIIRKRIDDLSKNIAEGGGALATISFSSTPSPATYNNFELTKKAELILEKAIGGHNIIRPPYVPAGEDFAFYQEKIPGLFLLLGITPKNQDPQKVALNHSPYFYIDESGLLQGVKVLSQLAYGYLKK